MNAYSPILAHAAPTRHRFTLAQVLAMTAADHVPRRVELLDGEIIDMPSEGEGHIVAKNELARALILALADDLRVGVDSTLPLADENAPSPDLYVLRREALGKMGRADAVLLVIEIAESSLAYDLSRKAALYASYGLQEYWVIDVGARVVHVLANPEGAVYRDILTHPFETALTPRALPGLSVRMADLMAEAGAAGEP